MKLKSILEKMNLMKKQTISTGLPLSALEQGSISISDVKPREKGTSDEEARHAVALDLQYTLNQYAAFACGLADQMFEEYGDSQDPRVRAALEEISLKKEAALRSLKEYNETCAEERRSTIDQEGRSQAA